MSKTKYKNGNANLRLEVVDLDYAETSTRMVNFFDVVTINMNFDIPKNVISLSYPSLYNCVDFFYDKLQTNKDKANTVYEIDFGGINLYVSLLKTKEEILEEYAQNVENRETYFNRNKGQNLDDLQKTWQMNQVGMMEANLTSQKDPLLGLKLLLTNANPEAMRILDLLQDAMGNESAEAYMKVMEKNNIGPEEIKDAYHLDSAGSIDELKQIVKDDKSELEDLNNKPETKEVKAEKIDTEDPTEVKKKKVKKDMEEYHQEEKDGSSTATGKGGSIVQDILEGDFSGAIDRVDKHISKIARTFGDDEGMTMGPPPPGV